MISIKKIEQATRLNDHHTNLSEGLNHIMKVASLIAQSQEGFMLNIKPEGEPEPEQNVQQPQRLDFRSIMMGQLEPYTPPKKKVYTGEVVSDYDLNISSAMGLKIISFIADDMKLQMLEIENDLEELGVQINQKR